MTRARNADGTFMSKEDELIAAFEAQERAEIAALMATGLSFDEAHIANGGEIITTSDASPECVAEVRAAYAKIGREPPVVRYKETPP